MEIKNERNSRIEAMKIVALFYCIMLFVTYHLSGLSFWVEHEGIWYVYFLISLYFITPLLACLIDKTKYRIVATTILDVSGG